MSIGNLSVLKSKKTKKKKNKDKKSDQNNSSNKVDSKIDELPKVCAVLEPIVPATEYITVV